MEDIRSPKRVAPVRCDDDQKSASIRNGDGVDA